MQREMAVFGNRAPITQNIASEAILTTNIPWKRTTAVT
jgi:hypothetical protein